MSEVCKQEFSIENHLAGIFQRWHHWPHFIRF